MAMTSKRGRPRNRACPECSAPLDGVLELHPRGAGGGGVGGGGLAICPACAAVSIRDDLSDRYRPLVTQEWLDLVLQARWYDVLEARGQVLERLTGPPEGLA